jgi:ATP/maltotriose-dependent transcriptional regulator MalT
MVSDRRAGGIGENTQSRTQPAVANSSGGEVTPLIGRTAQIEEVDRALARVTDGRFAVVEISGEPGIGKTRMLDELGHRARARGLPVYLGRATEFEQEVPFGMYAEALDPLVDAGTFWSGRQHGSATDRFQVYSAVRRLLADSAPAGAVLLLDDVHWADRSSLELTEYLIRKSPRRPLLIAIAFRTNRTPVRVLDAIIHHGPAAIRIHLPQLRQADLERLLPDVPAQRRDMILRASHGNPLFVQAASRLPDSPLAAMLSDDDGDDSAGHILAGLAGGLLTADQDVQAVAHAAAVAGDQASVHLVAHVAQLPTESAVAALDHLYALGLLDVDGTKCRFRHPLMRAAARGLYGPARRAAAHARAAGYLRAHHGPLQILAHHTERSARPGDDTAARTLVEAGQSFAYSAPALASRWLATALRIMPSDGPLGELRPSIQLSYARTLGICGELDQCREVLAGLRHAGEPVRTEAEAFGAVVARLRGDIDEAAAMLNAQLRRGRLGPATEGKLRVQLATINALREDGVATMAQAGRALGLLGQDHTAFAAAAQALRAFGALYDGEIQPAQGYIGSALTLIDAVNDAELRPHVELFGPLVWVEAHLGQLPAAARHLARAKDVVAQIGQSSALPYLLVVEAALRTRTGRLELALRRAREAAVAAERLGSAEMLAMADAVLLRPLLWSAGPAAAIAVGKRLTDSGRPRSPMWRRVARLNLALAAVVAGDPRTCLDLLGESGSVWPVGPPTAVPRHLLRAVALARLGQLPQAQTCATQAHESAVAAGLPYELGLAGYGLAYVAAKAGRRDEAATLGCRAAAQLCAAGAPLDAALAHHLAGRVHVRAGRLPDGRAELHRALAGFQECDAHWLRSLSAADKDSGQGGADLLTAREREIAGLVATGLSNQEIAERLVLSRRTIESHLSRIFAKLDVRSRTAMVNALDQGAWNSVEHRVRARVR